jgi:threonine aldolase
MENAHSDGSVVPLSLMKEIKALAEEWGLPVHLDGARLFNAACVLGVPAADIAACADSVMFCLSKGLCAPVGSLLAGTKEFAERARLKRKIMGGGMRQAGFLAAAGIVALNEMTGRLAEDHARAKRLAAAISPIRGVTVDTTALDINMVFFEVEDGGEREERRIALFRDAGIVINAPQRVIRNGKAAARYRFVTHYWIGDAELERVIAATQKAFG